ncbi:MAG: TIGR02466 family protein [Candidatus Competibacteraceae bacterium]
MNHSERETRDMVSTVRKTVLPIFATPISNYRFPDVDAPNETLRAFILQREQSDAGISRSNVGGWHSSTDFFEWDSGCVRELGDRLRAYLQALCRTVARNPDDPASNMFRLEGWANVLRHGQYNSLHSHPNAFWSGVYYVNGNPKPEDEHPFSGKLELIDPRPGASLNYSDHTNLYGRFLVNPVPGQMVVFPGWLQHQVHPYFGPGERITIAFNVIMI